MNPQTNESRDNLSRDGHARRQHMLAELQDELTSVHRTRVVGRRRLWFGSTCVCLLAVVLIGIANPISFDSRPVASKPAPPIGLGANILPAGASNLPAYFSKVSNSDNIVDRYVVRHRDPSIKLVSIDNKELLELLDAAGRPSVLGKIDGELTAIPSTALATNSDVRFLNSD